MNLTLNFALSTQIIPLLGCPIPTLNTLGTFVFELRCKQTVKQMEPNILLKPTDEVRVCSTTAINKRTLSDIISCCRISLGSHVSSVT